MDVTLNWIDTTNGAGVYKIYRSDKGIDVNFLPEPLDITISEYTHESQLNPDSGLPGTDINGGSNQRWLTAKDTVADGGLYQYIISVSDDSGGESFSEVMYFGNDSDLEPISFLAGSEVPFEYRMVGGTGTINYGDGTIENLVADTPTRIVHTYSEATSHVVTIQLITPAVLLEVSADSLLKWGGGYYKIHIRNPKMRLPEEFTPDIESMEGMLSGWEGVSDISGWEVTNARDMDNLFLNSPLFNQDLSRWNVGNVWWLNNTFNKASAFNGNLKRWGLHSVISMDGTFANATLFDSKINRWDVSNVRSMEGMFGNAPKFNQDLSLWCVKQFDNAPLNFDTSATAWALPKPVWGTCPVAPDTSTIELRRTPTGENNGYGEDQLIIRFNGTGALVDFNDGRGENWYREEAVHYYDEIDYNVEKVATLKLDDYCDLLETNADKVIRWGSKYNSVKFTSNIKEVPLTLGEDITSCAYMFSDATEFNGDISGWDTSSITDMSSMFVRCRMFNQDLSGWNTSNVTSLNNTFDACESFNGNVSTWNTSKVTDMSSTFSGCYAFNQDLSGWDVSNVTEMGSMFSSCNQFNSDISGWDVSNVTNMYWMFAYCTNFNQDLSSWCVSNITTVPYDFDTDTTAWVLPKPVWGTCPSNDPTKALMELVDRHETFIDRNTGITYDGEFDHFIQTPDGLLSNNRHFIAKTQIEYQPNGDATTEGQALHVIGYAYLYMVTKDPKYLLKAEHHWDAYHKYFYRNQPIPETPTRWICNWIANSKEPVLANWPINPEKPTQGGYKRVLLNFVDGKAQVPHGSPYWGEYMDVATYAHRGHMSWGSINASLIKIAMEIDWELLYNEYRVTDMPDQPYESDVWIDWGRYCVDHGLEYSVDWDTSERELPINLMVTWRRDLIGIGPGPDDQLWSGDVVESDLDASRVGEIVLVDRTINGPYFVNYAVRLPVEHGGYMLDRGEVWHNRPIHTPLLGSKNQMGNAADAEEWFADASYLLWKSTGKDKYHKALQASLYTNIEYTHIDMKDKFFRRTVDAGSLHTDGISYEYTYPSGILLDWGRTDNGFSECKVPASAQVSVEQQAIWPRIDRTRTVRTEYGGVTASGDGVSAMISVNIGLTKQDPDPVRYGSMLPMSETGFVESHDVLLGSLVRLTKEDGSPYMLTDPSAVTYYGNVSWHQSYETGILGDRSGSVMTAHFPDDSGGAIIGMWLLPDKVSEVTSITYRANAPMNIRIVDDNQLRWYWLLPDTEGEWVTMDLRPEDLVRSGYQPDWDSEVPMPDAPVYSAMDQISVLLDRNDTDVEFSYYCLNELPQQFTGDDGYVHHYTLTTTASEPFTFWVGDCYVPDQRPDGLAYSPGVIPFSNIYEEGSDQIGAWHGMPYPGYQYPFIYSLEPEKYNDRLENMCNFLHDAQQYYHETIGELGPVASAYVWDRWDNYKYGDADTFTMYHWGDGQAWSGYQPRAFQGAARALQELHYRSKPLPPKLVTYVTHWVEWLVDFAQRSGGIMPSHFPTHTPAAPDKLDFTSHMTGLWLAGMAMAWEVGIRPEGAMNTMQACVEELTVNMADTGIPGHPMDGAWSTALRLPGLNGMAFGFHTGEVYRGLAMFNHILSSNEPLYPVDDSDVEVNVSREFNPPIHKTTPWL